MRYLSLIVLLLVITSVVALIVNPEELLIDHICNQMENNSCLNITFDDNQNMVNYESYTCSNPSLNFIDSESKIIRNTFCITN